MTTTLKLNVLAVFSEHCYVQHSFMKVEDNNHEVWMKLTGILKSLGITMYWNHFALKCIDGDAIYYIGYNDGKLSLGMTIGKMKDSQTVMEFDYSKPQRIIIKF